MLKNMIWLEEVRERCLIRDEEKLEKTIRRGPLIPTMWNGREQVLNGKLFQKRGGWGGNDVWLVVYTCKKKCIGSM